MTQVLLVFIASGTVVVLAGTALARAADAIASHTGVGRLWIGSVLLAAATSLPELTTDVAAVRIGAPDLAAGDLFGSSMANMLILALIGILPPRGELFRRATVDHALTACLALALTALAALFVMIRPEYAVLGVGPGSWLIVIVFVAGMRVVFRLSARHPAGPVVGATRADLPAGRLTLTGAAVRFAIASALILAAAPAFAGAAQRIAELSGLGSTFVGTWLVGISTSLPEVVSSIAAVRIGAFDLAVGNLFGSNAFNMCVFFAMDLAHPGGPVFSVLDPAHVVSALFAMLLMALGLAAIVYRAERRFALLEPGSALMFLVYVFGLWTLYARTAGAP